MAPVRLDLGTDRAAVVEKGLSDGFPGQNAQRVCVVKLRRRLTVERTLISFNFPNIITITLMAALGFALASIVSQVLMQRGGG
jgi:hypothetical protein